MRTSGGVIRDLQLTTHNMPLHGIKLFKPFDIGYLTTSTIKARAGTHLQPDIWCHCSKMLAEAKPPSHNRDC